MGDFELDLPDHLYLLLTQAAAAEGVTLDELISRVIKEEIDKLDAEDRGSGDDVPVEH